MASKNERSFDLLFVTLMDAVNVNLRCLDLGAGELCETTDNIYMRKPEK